MHKMDSDALIHTIQDVDKICSTFLHSRKLSYFQFKRVYKDGSFIILANHHKFFTDFLENAFAESPHLIPFHTQQSTIYLWDEASPTTNLPLISEKKGIFHSITFVSRRKNFYDCTTFAMSKRHASPFSHYFLIIKEMQTFVEIFPTLARSLIEKTIKKPIKIVTPRQGRKSFFLPKRSARFHIGEGAKDYVTTYEVLCLRLLQEGKSYKEIGSILSMSPNTVETHLVRLKARTGLTLQELSLQSFQHFGNKKNTLKSK